MSKTQYNDKGVKRGFSYKKGNIEDEEFKQNYFLSGKTAIYILIVVILLYIILKMMGY